MPKPLEGVQGSGMHTHMSLFRGDDNAFFDEGDAYSLSPTAKSFMAGLLRHAAEITAITNQTVNSYKRLVPGFEAPVHVSWARNNRSGLIRVPIAKRNNPLATRVEYRSPDPACNPYLTFSAACWPPACAASSEGYELPVGGRRQPVRDRRRRARQAVDRPAAAVARPTPCTRWRGPSSSTTPSASTSSSGSCATSGTEWRDYKTHVSDFEINRYLRSL